MNSAIISPCGLYRYRLERELGGPGGPVVFIMLNPSTADANQDDPTIRRCIGFGKAWDRSRLIVGNLFAYRSTDPKVLKKVPDPIGPDNDQYLFDMCLKPHTLVVLAYGAGGDYRDRGVQVRYNLKVRGATCHYLKLTQVGHPQHPLYLPGNLVPQEIK